jgi:hypothetical protein
VVYRHKSAGVEVEAFVRHSISLEVLLAMAGEKGRRGQKQHVNDQSFRKTLTLSKAEIK